MNLMQRRRALLENDVLYRLENYSFDTEPINTNVKLFKVDHDWSIAFDANLTTNPTSGSGSAWRLACSWSKNIGGYSVNIGKGNGTTRTLAFIYMTTGNNHVTVSGISVGTGRYRFIITHTKNSGSATIKIRKDTGTVKTFSQNNTFVADSSNVYFGMPADANRLPKGTINKAIVYNRTLSASEINAFLGV